MRLRWWLRAVEGVLLVVGAGLMSVWLGHEREARAFQQSAASAFESATRTPPSTSPAVARAPEHPSRRTRPRADEQRGSDRPVPAATSRRSVPPVIGRLEIPRLGISAMVAEGMDPGVLALAVGHVPATALPGRAGNCALAGHRDSFLRGLGNVRRNDLVRFTTLDGTHTYRVAWGEVVDPSRTDVLAATKARSLTLVTCYPFEMVGRAPERFVVRAVEIGTDPARLQ
jgi:sortase A